MLEPFSVGVYACERGQVSAGHSVLITGACAALVPPAYGIAFFAPIYDSFLKRDKSRSHVPLSFLFAGAGPIGLTTLLAARAFGATNIILAGTDLLTCVCVCVACCFSRHADLCLASLSMYAAHTFFLSLLNLTMCA